MWADSWERGTEGGDGGGGGGVVQIGLRHTNRRKSQSDVSIHTVLWFCPGRLYGVTADRQAGGQKDIDTEGQRDRLSDGELQNPSLEKGTGK